MPTPTKEELKSNDRDGYIGRCIAVRESEGNKDRTQNVAICMDMWQRAKDKE